MKLDFQTLSNRPIIVVKTEMSIIVLHGLSGENVLKCAVVRVFRTSLIINKGAGKGCSLFSVAVDRTHKAAQLGVISLYDVAAVAQLVKRSSSVAGHTLVVPSVMVNDSLKPFIIEA